MELSSEFFWAAVFGGSIAGALMGLFPLIIGFMLERGNSALIGFFWSIGAGMILGVIGAFPVSLGVCIYIANKERQERLKRKRMPQY